MPRSGFLLFINAQRAGEPKISRHAVSTLLNFNISIIYPSNCLSIYVFIYLSIYNISQLSTTRRVQGSSGSIRISIVQQCALQLFLSSQHRHTHLCMHIYLGILRTLYRIFSQLRICKLWDVRELITQKIFLKIFSLIKKTKILLKISV